MRILLSIFILLSSLQAQAYWTCGEVLSKPAIGFFKYLFDGNPGREGDSSPSVQFVGLQKDGRLAFRQKRFPFRLQRRSWDSSFNMVSESSTPQGDLRNFIFLAGPRLAYKFGFEFREDLTGVTLLAPNAARIEKIIRVLNKFLIERGKEPITYLPKRSNFLSPGESLRLATEHNGEGGILVQFPFADSDRELVLHEVAYHLGSILFPKTINQKSNELNQITYKMSQFLQQSKLPHSQQIAIWLIGLREAEMDIGNANLQLKLASIRKNSRLYPYSRYFFDAKSLRDASNAVGVLVRPSYSPMEYVTRRLIRLLSLESHFADQKALTTDLDSVDKKYFDEEVPEKFKIPKEEALVYIPLIRKMIEEIGEPRNLFLRPTPEIFLRLHLLESLESRIQELNDAFDAIGTIP